ncbi:hypothetical protein [Corynebacterium matruchotii]|uniref:hypothetical protein n=1 Tax=Corynebacterium matruchotii TaxID=43768 RepID=UPI003C70B611
MAAGGNTVDLAVGRPEWLLSPEVPSGSGLTSSLSAAEGDPIAGIIDTARAAGITGIYLTLDAMATTTLAKPEYQELRSVSRDGTIRNDLGSAYALTKGHIGDMLEAAARHLAARYGTRINGIILTEIHWDSGSFSDKDLELFKQDTGEADWTRRGDGTPHEGPKELAWFGDKMAEAAGRIKRAIGTTQLVFDVRVNWANPVAGRPDSGHDYAKLLRHADLLQPWVYFDAGQAGKAAPLVEALTAQWPGKIRPSIGLWGAGGTTIPATDLDAAITSLRIQPWLQVTPASKLTTAHWQVLKHWR